MTPDMRYQLTNAALLAALVFLAFIMGYNVGRFDASAESADLVARNTIRRIRWNVAHMRDSSTAPDSPEGD